MASAHSKEKSPSVARNSLAYDVLVLLAQIAAIALGIIVIFTFVFGIMRVTDPGMEPRFQDGDLVLFYRVGKQYQARDVIVFQNNGLLTSGRIVDVTITGRETSDPLLIRSVSYPQGTAVPDTTFDLYAQDDYSETDLGTPLLSSLTANEDGFLECEGTGRAD